MISIKVSTITFNPSVVKGVFLDILADYCRRFSVIPTDTPIHIDFNFNAIDDEDYMNGLVVYKRDDCHNYIVQMRDPP